jgi:putative peptidoglycan lipid II flippase
VLYTLLGSVLYRTLGAPGIALTDSIIFTLEAVALLILLAKFSLIRIRLDSTLMRTILGTMTAALVTWGSLQLLTDKVPLILSGTLPMLLGFVASLPWIWREIKLLTRL